MSTGNPNAYEPLGGTIGSVNAVVVTLVVADVRPGADAVRVSVPVWPSALLRYTAPVPASSTNGLSPTTAPGPVTVKLTGALLVGTTWLLLSKARTTTRVMSPPSALMEASSATSARRVAVPGMNLVSVAAI